MGWANAEPRRMRTVRVPTSRSPLPATADDARPSCSSTLNTIILESLLRCLHVHMVSCDVRGKGNDRQLSAKALEPSKHRHVKYGKLAVQQPVTRCLIQWQNCLARVATDMDDHTAPARPHGGMCTPCTPHATCSIDSAAPAHPRSSTMSVPT